MSPHEPRHEKHSLPSTDFCAGLADSDVAWMEKLPFVTLRCFRSLISPRRTSIQLAAVEWLSDLPVEKDRPFELGTLPTDLALDENDNLEAVHFFTTSINPWSEHNNNVNKLLADARLWNRHLPHHRDTIRDGTFLFRRNDIQSMPFDLLVEVRDSLGVKTLKLSQHPLLGISRHTRRAFLDDWYLHNDFKVSFDTALAARNRSHFEKGMKLLSPRHKTLILTPAPMTISPRLLIEVQMPQGKVTFASLLQCFRIFYDGLLGKKELEKIGDIGLGTGPPRVTNWRLTWDTKVEDQKHVMVVLYGLRELATAQSLADDSDHPRRRSEEDLGRMVYEWMVSKEDPSRIEDRMRVCELISPQFKELGFRSAMQTQQVLIVSPSFDRSLFFVFSPFSCIYQRTGDLAAWSGDERAKDQNTVPEDLCISRRPPGSLVIIRRRIHQQYTGAVASTRKSKVTRTTASKVIVDQSSHHKTIKRIVRSVMSESRPQGSKTGLWAGSKTLTRTHRRTEPVHTDSSPSFSQIMKSRKLPGKSQRKLLFEHLDFGGAEDKVTGSDSDVQKVNQPDTTALDGEDNHDDKDIEVCRKAIADRQVVYRRGPPHTTSKQATT
ncbi:hypothetical protein KCU81_g6519, partial [Aureobasidium melanogenum]